MSDPEIRALTIAPYAGMGIALRQAALNLPGIRLDIRSGDLDEAIALLDRLDQSRYDVIISRGGTAKMLQHVTRLPVVEVRISVYDMLRSIKLAENYRSKYAIVGFESITEPAHVLCELLKKDLRIKTLLSGSEADRVLTELKNDGYQMIICDMVTYQTALRLGLDAYLITSGAESVREALEEAAERGKIFRTFREQLTMLDSLLSGSETSPFILNGEGKCLYPGQEGRPGPELVSGCMRRLPELSRAGVIAFYHTGKSELRYITGRTALLNGETLYLFYQTASALPARSARAGIYSFQRAECEDFLKGTFFSVPGAADDVKDQLRQAAAAGRPVILSGETGCGQEQAARRLYLDSSRRSRPLVLVDCPAVNDRGWDYLFRHPLSPFNRSGSTLWINRPDALGESRTEELMSMLYQTAVSRREQLIFTVRTQRDRPPWALLPRLTTQLSCHIVPLVPLRDRAETIPFLAAQCLTYLNAENGTQISGLDSRALEQLRQFDWPENTDQFLLVMRQLVSTASGAYIRGAAVSDLLRLFTRGRRQTAADPSGIAWRDRSLEEILMDAVRLCLEEHGGNQTRAARALGISRATMWRYLKQTEAAEPGR